MECHEVLEYLKGTRGFDFSGYKTASLYRRLNRRMQMLNIETCADYLDYLEVHPDEFTQLFNTILINVTSFFRDSSAWESLQSILTLRLLGKQDDHIRIWCAGCASGEEPYTIIMLLAEMLGIEAVRERVKIYATDIDDEALQEARLAAYSAREIAYVPEPLVAKYFRTVNGKYHFSSELRRNVIFGKHDLMNDAPISRVDLLTCRNTMMYFNSEVQSRILSRFHFALNPAGVLMLGKAEMLFTHMHLFNPLDLKGRIFTKRPKLVVHDGAAMAPTDSEPQNVEPNLEKQPLSKISAWLAVFDTLPTAQVILNPDGSVAMINAEARRLFRLDAADVGRQLHEMEISYRPVELRSLIERAYQARQAVTVEDAPYTRIIDSKAETGFLNLQVAPIYDADSATVGVTITFTETTHSKELKDELQEANRELETAYEELQSTNEELETTNEELQSTNEELETTNEELQSTNEELETMNEELQSTNEELHAINDELRERSHDLNKANTFMSSMMSSLQAGVAVLDHDLQVQVWNERAEDLWGVRSDEAVGRSLLALDIGLPLEGIATAFRAVASDEQSSYDAILEATNRRGKAVQCKVTLTRLGVEYEGARGILLLMEMLQPA